MSAPYPNQKMIKDLEIKKLEVMVKIRELQQELQKMNLELYKQGVDIQTALCW